MNKKHKGMYYSTKAQNLGGQFCGRFLFQILKDQIFQLNLRLEFVYLHKFLFFPLEPDPVSWGLGEGQACFF